MTKKWAIPLMCAALLPGLAAPQTFIANPEKPSSPKAGRVLGLREALRISDKGGEFFFQYPREIKIAPDGSYFVFDREQLLRFDPKGVFIRNFFKKGQGPGELSYVSNFDFVEGLFLVHSNNPNKFVWFSYDGTLVKELRLHDIGYLTFECARDGVFYGYRRGLADTGGRLEVVDIPHILMAVTQDGASKKELCSFPIQTLSSGTAGVSTTGLIAVPYKDRYLFVSHTSDYMVKLCDLRSGEVVRSFNRKYKRIKRPEGSGGSAIVIDGKTHEPPGSDHLNDISDLCVFKDTLWVLTSVKDKEKGYLIDVFDPDGKYVDAFYLNTKGRLMGTQGDSIFIREQDENELVSIVEYKVADDKDGVKPTFYPFLGKR